MRGNSTNIEKLPSYLKQNGLFCLWKYEKRDGRRTKVPYNPNNPQYGARSCDRSTFADLNTAAAHAAGFDGLGIGVFDSIAGIDIDHCVRSDGTLNAMAKEIVEAMDTYTEISPSGTGLRILFLAPEYSYEKEKYYIKHDFLEVYIPGMTNRFLTVTGNTIRDMEMLNRSDRLQPILDKYMKRPQPKTKAKPATPATPLTLSDNELIAKASAAANGAKFTALWNGDISGYLSQSEADQALCNILAFWTGNDAARIDSLFRQSGLMRNKWDERRSGSTYGADTIENALNKTTEVYNSTPQAKPERKYKFPDIPAEEPTQDKTAPVEQPAKELEEIQPPKRADAVQDEIHRYLWKPYIPEEDYSILMAAGGTGKTMFCCWLAAQVTKGGFLPGDQHYSEMIEKKIPEPANVLYISSEEMDWELRHRFVLSGGDPTRFYIYDREDSLGMSFTDGYSDFIRRVQSCTPKLVIIDPWQAFIGEAIDTNKVNHVRPALQKLALIAKRCRCSIVLISHVNKKPQSENINNAATGSSEFVNAARSGLMITYSEDAEDKNGRILVHTKSNYAAAGDSLKFHITPLGGFEYDGTSLITRDILEAAARNRKTVAETLAMMEENRNTKNDLIEAIKSMAKPGETVRVAYKEMIDTYGEDIFGAGRPSFVLKSISGKLKKLGITIETKTATGTYIQVAYNGKKSERVFTIFQKSQK